MSPRARNLAVGGAAAIAGAAGGILVGRTAVHRMRLRPDPEAGEPFGMLPPDDLGRVRSFDGTELAVRAAGPEGAPTLVFTHGITLDMTTWYYQWTRFSDRYRCVLFDHRAHGRSGPPPTDDYTVRALGRDLRAVLDHAVPRGPVVLVGHSLGGMAIVAMAEHHPEEFGGVRNGRVAGVVLADTAVTDVLKDLVGRFGPGVERTLRLLANRYVVDRSRAERLRGRIQSVGDELAFLIARATNFGPDPSPAQIEHVTRISAAAPVEVWTDMLRGLFEMDLRHALSNVRVPALVIVGDRDTITPKTSATALQSALPDARAVVITRAGHLCMMERHRVFNGLLEGFLDDALATDAVSQR